MRRALRWTGPGSKGTSIGGGEAGSGAARGEGKTKDDTRRGRESTMMSWQLGTLAVGLGVGQSVLETELAPVLHSRKNRPVRNADFFHPGGRSDADPRRSRTAARGQDRAPPRRVFFFRWGSNVRAFLFLKKLN